RRNAAQSELAAARARAVTARQQVSRTEVRAPFDGVVSERKVSVGDTVQIGRELVKVIDPNSMRFEGQVSADRLGELKLGQPVAFRINGFGDAEFRGKLARIDASANATTRQVELVAEFNDRSKAPQVAGLYAEGRVESADRRALVLAEGSVQRQGDNITLNLPDGITFDFNTMVKSAGVVVNESACVEISITSLVAES
ncbi:MAG: HlyD family efflux transporter periplasmic adaptor subunit, partial [Candidatus Dadabacteria bacterium]